MKQEYKAPALYGISFVIVLLLAVIPNPAMDTGNLLLLIWTLPWSLVNQVIVLFMIHEGYGNEAKLFLSLAAAALNAGILLYWGSSIAVSKLRCEYHHKSPALNRG